MDWIPMVNVDFTSIWTWIAMGAGALSARAGWWAIVWMAPRRAAVIAKNEAALDRIEARLPGLAEQAEAISAELAEPPDTYEAIMHRNYHIGQKFGPVPGCPHCPQKAG